MVEAATVDMAAEEVEQVFIQSTRCCITGSVKTTMQLFEFHTLVYVGGICVFY